MEERRCRMSRAATIVNLQRAALAASQAYGIDHPVTLEIRAQIEEARRERADAYDVRTLATNKPIRGSGVTVPVADFASVFRAALTAKPKPSKI